MQNGSAELNPFFLVLEEGKIPPLVHLLLGALRAVAFFASVLVLGCWLVVAVSASSTEQQLNGCFECDTFFSFSCSLHMFEFLKPAMPSVFDCCLSIYHWVVVGCGKCLNVVWNSNINQNLCGPVAQLGRAPDS